MPFSHDDDPTYEAAWKDGAQAEAEAVLDGRLELLQGARIRLFLRREGTWKEAVVEAFHARSGRHRVKVGDGAPQILLLKEERWLPLGTFPPSPSKQSAAAAAASSDASPASSKKKGRGAVRFAEAPAPPPEQMNGPRKMDLAGRKALAKTAPKLRRLLAANRSFAQADTRLLCP